MASGRSRDGLPRRPVAGLGDPDLTLLYESLHYHGAVQADPVDAREGDLWLRADLDPMELRALWGGVVHVLVAEGDADASVAAHVAAPNPHPQYLTEPEGDAAYDALGTAAAITAMHEADTTGVHGIANTAALVLTGDARLSDARTPTAHAASHAAAGSDPLTLANLAGDLLPARITGLTETVQDLVAALLVAGANVTLTYDDGAGTLTVAVVSFPWLSLTGVPTTFTPSVHAHTATDVTDFSEAVDDRVAVLLTAGANVSLAYNDASGALTITVASFPYGSLTGVPATFTPAAHTHAAADIVSGTIPVVRGGTGLGSLANGSLLRGTGGASHAGVAIGAANTVLKSNGTLPVYGSVAYSELTGVPATFAPSAHTHPASAITDFSEAVDDRVAALAIAGTNVTITYNDASNTLTWAVTSFPYGSLTGTPASFTPSAHAASHADGGADEVSMDASQTITGTFLDARIPAGVARYADATTRYNGTLSATPGGGVSLGRVGGDGGGVRMVDAGANAWTVYSAGGSLYFESDAGTTLELTATGGMQLTDFLLAALVATNSYQFPGGTEWLNDTTKVIGGGVTIPWTSVSGKPTTFTAMAHALNSATHTGTLDYAQLPSTGGTWNAGGGNIVLTASLQTSGRVSIGGAGSWGGSAGAAIFLTNVTTVPTTNPTGGGIAYAQGGAGKWRGPSGTVTTWGTAEPHCPVCGADFMLEWENEGEDAYLAICMKCMADEMGPRPYILRIKE